MKKLWYAVGGTGQGFVFTSPPVRDETRKTWLGESVACVTMLVMLFESEGFRLPVLKWTDEPVELQLTLKI